jgi:hypothetical protein
MNKTIVFVGLALLGGYLIGSSKDSNKTSAVQYRQVYVPSSSRVDESEVDELRTRMESARRNLEDALSDAQDTEFNARMRWIQTGSFEDMMSMRNAEDNTMKIQGALDDLD